MPYQTLNHTSELMLRVIGKNLQDLFSAAVAGTMHILKKKFDPDKLTLKRQVIVTAPDITTLLIDFLNETLYLANTNKEIYGVVKFKQLDHTHLIANLVGYSINSFDADIKAVTYHQANVHRNQAGEWETKIIFDI